MEQEIKRFSAGLTDPDNKFEWIIDRVCALEKFKEAKQYIQDDPKTQLLLYITILVFCMPKD